MLPIKTFIFRIAIGNMENFATIYWSNQSLNIIIRPNSYIYSKFNSVNVIKYKYTMLIGKNDFFILICKFHVFTNISWNFTYISIINLTKFGRWLRIQSEWSGAFIIYFRNNHTDDENIIEMNNQQQYQCQNHNTNKMRNKYIIFSWYLNNLALISIQNANTSDPYMCMCIYKCSGNSE